jgi:choline-sulfatase
MSNRGYRTFGVGKFHTLPWDADLGYDAQLRSEELYESPHQRASDAYASFIAREHPEYDFLEGLMGERTEMYYVPQASALPAGIGVEAWAADRVCELVRVEDRRPFFGVLSFIGPHPPFAPPLPFNRYYDPDDMDDPLVGDIETDHMDEQIPWMNYAVYADDVSPGLARVLKARF